MPKTIPRWNLAASASGGACTLPPTDSSRAWTVAMSIGMVVLLLLPGDAGRMVLGKTVLDVEVVEQGVVDLRHSKPTQEAGDPLASPPTQGEEGCKDDEAEGDR